MAFLAISGDSHFFFQGPYIGGNPGLKEWHYITPDSLTTVIAAGYIDDASIIRAVSIGDYIRVFQCASRYDLSTQTRVFRLKVIDKSATALTLAAESIGVGEVDSTLYASQSEAEAATDTTKIMPSLRVSQQVLKTPVLYLDPTLAGTDVSAALGAALNLIVGSNGGTLMIPSGLFYIDSLVSKSFGNLRFIAIKGVGPSSRLVVRNSSGGIALTCSARNSPVTLENLSLEPGIDGAGVGFAYSAPASTATSKRVFVARNINMVPQAETSAFAFNGALSITGGIARPLFDNVIIDKGGTTTTIMDYIIRTDGCYRPEFHSCRLIDIDSPYGISYNGEDGEGVIVAHCLIKARTALSLRKALWVWVDDVACASTANIAVLSGEQTIDGVLTSASRVLLKNQTTASQNGIWITGAGAWVRSYDADFGYCLVNLTVQALAGTANAGTYWYCTTPEPIVIGTTSLSFVSKTLTQIQNDSQGQGEAHIHHNQFACSLNNVVIDGIKQGTFCNNLFYNQLRGTSNGVGYDYKVIGASGLIFAHNTYRDNDLPTRRHIYLNIRPGKAITDIYILGPEMLNAITVIPPYYFGADVVNATLVIPQTVPGSGASYPTDLYEWAAGATNIRVLSEFNVTRMDSGAAEVDDFELFRESLSPADNDIGLPLGFYFRNHVNTKMRFAAIIPVMTDSTSGTEDGKLNFYAKVAGTETLIWSYSTTFNVTVQSLFADGVVALPGISFAADPDSGWWRQAANVVSLSLNGVEQLRIDVANLVYRSDRVIGWSSGTSLAAMDTAISRVSAGKAHIENGSGTDANLQLAALFSGSNQVVAARRTGWTAASGTADRTTYATYTSPAISNPPTQVEVQAIADHMQIMSRHLKALLDDAIAHGLIGT